MRFDGEVKLIVIMRKDIGEGEITVSYGDEGYREKQNEKGMWCGRGTGGCNWSEEAVTARADGAESADGEGEEGSTD